GECHVAWFDPDHPRDHLPARRLQRPLRRLRLWHGPFRHGAWRRRSGRSARADPAGQTVIELSICNSITYFLRSRFMIGRGGSRNYVKEPYIRGRNVVRGVPPVAALPAQPPTARNSAKKIKRSPTMRPMRPFNFNTAAELFPAAIRKKKRAGFAYR